jgi:hypothetical protein
VKNNCQFPKVLTLLSLALLFSPSMHAQSPRNPETDIAVNYRTQERTLYVEFERKSANLYECVRVEFDLYTRPTPGQEKKYLGVFSVEGNMRDFGKFSTWRFMPDKADASKKSITDCWESAANQSVTVYEDVKFGGRSKSFGVGKYRLFDLKDFNDSISSIEVPTGLVAIVYEDADEGGGYGRYVDFLENQPDLTKYDFAKQISYIQIFPTGRQWVRNALNNGRFEAGHSIAGRRFASPNPSPMVAPPLPAHTTTTPPPPPVFCSITGQVKNYDPMYKSVFTLTLRRDGVPTKLETKVTGAQYTISNVPEGTYEIVGSGFYPPNKHAIFVDGDSQQVTCSKGRANSVNFRIDSGD